MPFDEIRDGLAAFTGAKRRFEAKGEAGRRARSSTATPTTRPSWPPTCARPRDVVASFSGRPGHRGLPAAPLLPHPVLRRRVRRRARRWPTRPSSWTSTVPARTPSPGCPGALVAEGPAAGRRVAYAPTAAPSPALVAGRARPGDIVLTMGAGDVTELGPADRGGAARLRRGPAPSPDAAVAATTGGGRREPDGSWRSRLPGPAPCGVVAPPPGWCSSRRCSGCGAIQVRRANSASPPSGSQAAGRGRPAEPLATVGHSAEVEDRIGGIPQVESVVVSAAGRAPCWSRSWSVSRWRWSRSGGRSALHGPARGGDRDQGRRAPGAARAAGGPARGRTIRRPRAALTVIGALPRGSGSAGRGGARALRGDGLVASQGRPHGRVGRTGPSGGQGADRLLRC